MPNPKHWAIVIGINDYPKVGNGTLKGAVKDALKMTEWLRSPTGGDVPSHNLLLLLAPAPGDPPPPVPFSTATHEILIKAIRRIVEQSGGKGDRLFFYYSGHGLSAELNFSRVDVVLPTDFDPNVTTTSLTLRSIFEYFESKRFGEQYFFIDGCRNLPFEGRFRVGEFPDPPDFDRTAPAPQQFYFYATSSGVKAAEIRQAANERGAFTEVLLDGLNGKGAAKVWDISAQKYVVRVDRLGSYVVDRVSRMKLAVSRDPMNPDVITDSVAEKLFQVPRLGGEHGAPGRSNPILATYPASAFPAESLSVDVAPGEAIPTVTVIVQREDMVIDSKKGSQNPFSFSLPPKEYSIRAVAPQFEPLQELWPIELYEQSTVTVELRAGEARVAGTSPARHISIDSSGKWVTIGTVKLPIRGAEGRPSPLKERTPQKPDTEFLAAANQLLKDFGPGKLTVTASDPQSPLELCDSSGTILATGTGKLVQPNLQPGFYRARLVTPERLTTETLVQIEPGADMELPLGAPKARLTTLAERLVHDHHFEFQPDNTLQVSETLGSLATVQPSTIGLLATGLVNLGGAPKMWGHRLRDVVGSPPFDGPASANSGVHVLWMIDGMKPDAAKALLETYQVRLRSLDLEQPSAYLRLQSLADGGLAQLSIPAEPGPYWLSVSAAEQDSLRLALAVLPKHLSMVIVYVSSSGKMEVYQYLPAIQDGPITQEVLNKLRSEELMQRFYANGRSDHAQRIGQNLDQAGDLSLLMACLYGYMLLKQGEGSRLVDFIQSIATRSRGLPDEKVLQSELFVLTDSRDAIHSAAREALDRGIPAFSEGLRRLHDTVQRFDIRHPRRDMLEQAFQTRISGQIWSTCQ